MSSEKKFWTNLGSPFRRSLGVTQVSPGTEARRTHPQSDSRVSSVYLSDDSSAHGFVIVPEFDEPERTGSSTAQLSESRHSSQRFISLATEVSSSPLSQNDVDSCILELDTGTGTGSSVSLHDVSAGVADTPHRHTHGANQNLDFEQRLGSAYDHIRTMPSPVSPKALLSSDPRMLRKQLGVPQHSVINYPLVHLLDLPNPHVSAESHLQPSSEPERCEGTVSFSPNPGEPASRNRPSGHGDVESIRPPLFLSPEKPSLHINTDVPICYPATTFSQLPAQETPAITAGPVMIDSSGQFMSARTHHGAITMQSPVCSHATHSPEPRSPQNRRSKLIKRRVGSHLASPSVPPLPSDGQKAPWPEKLVGPSSREHKRRESLPQLRAPSPFQVDLPIHHSWHDRRTTFDFSGRCREIVTSTKPRRTSGSTEALASLAWIGTSPLTPNPSIGLRGGTNSTSGHSQIAVAIAVDDDSVSDDILVDRLERIRRIGSLPEQKHDSLRSSSSVTPRSSRLGGEQNDPASASPLHLRRSESNNALSSPLIPDDTTSDSEDAVEWQAVRKALLCIREIVRTERKYQEALKMLLNSQTVTPPPPSMLTYVPGLVQASEMLLKGFVEDPSVWGVSTAFMTCEDELEAAMVSWCGVAGAFFTGGNVTQSGSPSGRWRLRNSGMTPGSRTIVSSPSSLVAKQSSAPLTPQLPSMSTLMNAASSRIKERQRVDEEYWRTGESAIVDSESQTTSPASLRERDSPKSREKNGQPPSRRFSVRDLAIQPTQRVMRYVLLYRDLLDCTPSTSPSRPLVERALEAATRIASNCDREQRNPAFTRVQT